MRLHVRLTPGAAKDSIEGWISDAEGRPLLAARVRAPAREGEANAALEKLIARAMGVPVARVRVARGGASRVKALEIEGADAGAVERAFGKASG